MTGSPASARDAYPHFQPITTRWKDNDLYGHVNNVEYYSYFDSVINAYLIRAGGLDPDRYQGFAWGMGIDRIAMLKYGMPDLRAFFDADVRWLNHYGFRPLDLPTLVGGMSS